MRFCLVQSCGSPVSSELGRRIVVCLSAVEIEYWRGVDEFVAGGGGPGCECAVEDIELPFDACRAADSQDLRA